MFGMNLLVQHQQHGIMYCITQHNWYNRAGESSCYEVVGYSILGSAPDDERVNSFETCRVDKKLWNKNLL